MGLKMVAVITEMDSSLITMDSNNWLVPKNYLDMIRIIKVKIAVVVALKHSSTIVNDVSGQSHFDTVNKIGY